MIEIKTARQAAEVEKASPDWDHPAIQARDGVFTHYGAGLFHCIDRALEEVGEDASAEEFYAALDRHEDAYRELR